MWKTLVLGDIRKKIVMETVSEERENCGHCAAVSVRLKHSANKLHFSPVTSVLPAGASHTALVKCFIFSSSEKALCENYHSSETVLWRHLSDNWLCCSCSHPCAAAQKRVSNSLNCAKYYVFHFSGWKHFPLRSMILPGKTFFIQILSGLQLSLQRQGLMH